MIGTSNCTDIFEIIYLWEGGGIFFTASKTKSIKQNTVADIINN